MSPSSSTTSILPFAAVTADCGSRTVSGIHRFPLRLAQTGRALRPGKLDAKARPASRPAENLDTACMFLNDSVGHRKSQARALARALGCEKRIVNTVQVFRRDAVTRVHHVHLSPTIARGGLNFE